MIKVLKILFGCVFFLGSVSAVNAVDVPNAEVRRAAYSQSPELWPKAWLDESVDFVELGLLPTLQYPKDNPYSAAKYKLGYTLFHDGVLSASGQIACASCHDPDLGWADGRRVSFGHNRQVGKRNAPTIENAGFLSYLFWDGRASSLEQQALMPIEDPIEMAFTLKQLVQRLSTHSNYLSLFEAAYGTSKITVTKLAKALATFQRTIVSRRSDFDYFLLSIQEKKTKKKLLYSQKMSDEALWGLDLFRTKARCANCHHGPLLTDGKFHNLGFTWYGRKYEDLGRYLISNNAEDVGKFKTPGLRGVMNSKPWMHNGLFASMQGIINVYNAGGVATVVDNEDPLSPVTSPLLKPLSLSNSEKKAILAFLQSITASPAIAIKPE